MNKIVICLSLMIFASPVTYAASFGAMDAGAINTQYVKDLRLHEITSRSKNKNAIINSSNIKQENIVSDSQELKSVVFINNNSVPTEQLLQLVQDKINKPLTAENVAAIRKDIMKYYQSLGYYSAVAIINSQNSDGELVIEIKEGGKNPITIQE